MHCSVQTGSFQDVSSRIRRYLPSSEQSQAGKRELMRMSRAAGESVDAPRMELRRARSISRTAQDRLRASARRRLKSASGTSAEAGTSAVTEVLRVAPACEIECRRRSMFKRAMARVNRGYLSRSKRNSLLPKTSIADGRVA